MADFSIKTYTLLLKTLTEQDFSFCKFSEFLNKTPENAIVLRHDVDKLPLNSLEFARIESDAGIKGSYYFRAYPESWNEPVIKKIAEMGHEIGYHYEDLSFAYTKLKVKSLGFKGRGDELERKLAEIGIKSFGINLEKFRKIFPVTTICMHGSPMSRWDNRLLWKYYDYHDYGVIGDPYFDIDFNKVLYLTDTGRRWDGELVSRRDKMTGDGRQASGVGTEHIPESSGQGEAEPAPSNQQPATFPKFHSTFDIIRAAEQKKLPYKIMITFHPQRWSDKSIPWVKELIWQNVKNVGKYFLIKARNDQ